MPGENIVGITLCNFEENTSKNNKFDFYDNLNCKLI